MDGTTQTSTLIAQTSMPAPTPASQPMSPTSTGLDWTTIIVAVVTGVATGLLAPWIAPYANWYFKKKERQEARHREIVSEIREILDGEGYHKALVVLNHHNFLYIEGLLSPDARKQLHDLRSKYETFRLSETETEMCFLLRQALVEIEHKWGLVGK